MSVIHKRLKEIYHLDQGNYVQDADLEEGNLVAKLVALEVDQKGTKDD